jgi:acetyltransferase-like isoleucine patch superfamily enzyme
MPARSLSNPVVDSQALKAEFARADFSPRSRALLLALNLTPLVHSVLVAGAILIPSVTWPWRFLLAFCCLYLFPPISARLLQRFLNISEGKIALGSKDFFGWWALLQLQIIFCRFPALEEVLRLIPGAYSFWLRLWGARIGKLTFWSPGVLILDRPFLLVGNHVIFGAGVRISSHVLARDSASKLELLLGTVRIGDHALIGGYSLLTAGTEIAAGETTRAVLTSPPFSSWKGGKRERNTNRELR